MGAIHHGECPHCGKQNVQFSGDACTPSKAQPTLAGRRTWNLHMTCNSCWGPIALLVETDAGMPYSGDARESVVIPELGADPYFEIRTLAMYPEPTVPTAPPDTPDEIAEPFIEAQDNLKRNKRETCEMLCRKVLDIATRRLKPDINNFNARINALREDGTITPAMADWAHIVRMDGNGSTHSEEKTTPERARELVGFTEMFLIYAFALPAMVEARRYAK
ncbi:MULTISPECIES: DUF4145 domain-containing protein [unclassified Paraburkholderia]|uniref:DUF4145 domain-containing protein n=1 Tax=unclassified Paraburkholderia TaxID=2615204 RepID=UPI0016101FF5|nr:MULTISPECIES: DUF4145 domain-containing protein [unclassified Paraburkholderia]MBB5443264.1 hypothetical protein [Paraburkholderia sp. WSM4177]MBB5483130.1 hypothetical protein [Paraburkholderia sp. WSM4180]